MFEEASIQLVTLRDFLRFGISRFQEAGIFYGHGTTNAYDEAAYLLLHTLHLPIDNLDPFLDARLTGTEINEVLAILKERIEKRLPAAYLTHEAWLGHFKFYVDERVIVPRSFIAELLQEHLSPWVADPHAITSGLDLCTGSGCLAILMAHAFPNASIDAVDLSKEALEVARRNVDDYGLTEQIRLVQSDMFSALGNLKYDLIISNPPYVNAESMAALPQEYRHEPAMALASGKDGLDHVRVILQNAAAHLTDDGLLVVESGHNRSVLETAFPEISFTWLETSSGDEFVFLLTREQLAAL